MMKEKLKNKKAIYIIFGALAILLVTIVTSYAFWLITKTQTGQNTVASACLEIELSDETNGISLANQFPISDEEGMQTTPYTFTITNKCNTSLDYQVALESIGDEETALSASSLKVALDDSISLLSNKTSVDTTIEGAYASNRLIIGTLESKGSVTYNLRIWIDYDAPNSEQNKTYNSKISVTVGQNIVNNSNIKDGTLAYDIVSNYGGTDAISEIDQTELFETTTTGNSVYVYPSTSYYYGTSYAYDESTGKYTLSGTLTQATLTECRNGTKSCGKYTLKTITSTSSIATLYEITDFKTSGNYVTANTTISTNEFGKTANVVTGLYKTLDNYGDSYYFRGAVENNYVEFGKWETDYIRYMADGPTPEYYNTLEECESGNNHNSYGTECVREGIEAGTSMYWRIVRVNGDGTIRLIYDGTDLVENGVIHDTGIEFKDSNRRESGFIEYKSSESKDNVETWYANQLENNYSQYIADSIFCNDTEEASRNYIDESGNSIDSSEGAWDVEIYYKPRARFYNKEPKLICTQDKDKYTSNSEIGNGLLTYPIALITSDEVLFAGLGTSSYFYDGGQYFTMSPEEKFDYYGVNGAFYYTGSGLAGSSNQYISPINYRPVINLKADVQFTGSGTKDDPYVIVTE